MSNDTPQSAGNAAGPEDEESVNRAPVDHEPADLEPADTAPTDAAPADAAPADAAPADTPADAPPADAEPADAPPTDAAPAAAPSADSEPIAANSVHPSGSEPADSGRTSEPDARVGSAGRTVERDAETSHDSPTTDEAAPHRTDEVTTEEAPRRIDAVPSDVGEPEPSPRGASGLSDDTAAYDVVADRAGAREQPAPVILPPEPSRREEDQASARDAQTVTAEDQPEGREATSTDEAPVPHPVPYPATAAAATPMYVTAPTPPARRGNRLMGILIDVVAAVVYAIVFAAVALGLFALRDPHTAVNVWERYLQTAGFWVPVAVFFLAYALLIAIVNRGGWWAYMLGSFFVAVIVYFGYLAGALLTVQAWTLSLNEANQFIGTLWTNGLTIGSAVVAREVALWFGGWIAARGRRVRAANLEAQREYDRRMAAGPTASPAA